VLPLTLVLTYAEVIFLSSNRFRKGRTGWIINITLWTVFLAVLFGFVSQAVLKEIDAIFVYFFLLTLIIFTGIVFDTIGIAAAAAKEMPLHAKAAKKVYGAKNAILLVRRADRVASFCNDVVGDISGIVSGGVAALIIVQLAGGGGHSLSETTLNIALTACVAGLTVGGKAVGKSIAISRSEEIILIVSMVLTKIEDILRIRFFSQVRRK